MDVDGDGILSRQDIIAVSEVGKETGLSSSAIKEIDRIVQQIDIDGDGQITFEEFMALMALDCGDITSNVAAVRRVRRHGVHQLKEPRATLLQNDLTKISEFKGPSPCPTPPHEMSEDEHEHEEP